MADQYDLPKAAVDAAGDVYQRYDDDYLPLEDMLTAAAPHIIAADRARLVETLRQAREWGPGGPDRADQPIDDAVRLHAATHNAVSQVFDFGAVSFDFVPHSVREPARKALLGAVIEWLEQTTPTEETTRG